MASALATADSTPGGVAATPAAGTLAATPTVLMASASAPADSTSGGVAATPAAGILAAPLTVLPLPVLTGSAVPTVLSYAVLTAAERGDAAATLALIDQEGYRSIDTRSLYQSTLLHTAIKHGHVALARALLHRGADVNMLDYGGMRRSPLHWACHGNHVAMVEFLLEAGADITLGGYADGRSWSKLVQGSRCGSLIPKDQPTESVESMCRTNAVRLALMRPRWQPSIHGMWPQQFKDATRMLLLLTSSCPRSCGGDPSCSYASEVADSSNSGGCGGDAGRSSGSSGRLPLSQDTLLEVLQQAAYPISSWV